MQMVHNKKIGAALAVIAGVLGMSVSGSAMALPEMQVGTLPPIVAPQSVDTPDSAVAVSEDSDVLDPAS